MPSSINAMIQNYVVLIFPPRQDRTTYHVNGARPLLKEYSHREVTKADDDKRVFELIPKESQ